ncbi:MAG: hypothetical protein PHH37_05695 [Paludibacter sp.]|nr:hypothetical protein [Paludibacter sp.]
MKHIIFSLLLIVSLLTACEPMNQRTTDNHYMINLTNKKIVHVLNLDIRVVPQDSVVFKINGTCDTTLEWNFTQITGIHKPRLYGSLGSYKDFYVYNISDTTSIHWQNFYGGYEPDAEQMTEIFNLQTKEVIDSENNESNVITNYYLTVNDTLLKLMKKDYSMIERFKEYYQK